ncbi:MAG TPA: hypothetical protein VHF22_05560, partial [Planctomycetota bacterium]|nr:hypothetical protein [Planctomycetota bacterium]
LIQSLIAVSVVEDGARALENLVGAGTLGAGDLAEVDRELALLEPALPSAARALRAERAYALATLVRLGDGWRPPDYGFPALLETRAAVGLLWSGLDEILRAVEAAQGVEDATARDARLKLLVQQSSSSWNPYVRVMASAVIEADGSIRAGAKRVADLRAAVAAARAAPGRK